MTLGRLNAMGIENIILSMDKDGLIYSGRGYMYRVIVPSVDVRSTVGAGDSPKRTARPSRYFSSQTVNTILQ